MRVKSKVNVRIYESTTERDALFALDDTRAEVTNDHYTEMEAGRFSIAASGSLTLDLGTVNTVQGLYIRAVGNFDLTLNGSATDIEIRKPTSASATDPCKFYVDGLVTTAVVTNTSSTAVLIGQYVVWGDET